MRLSSVIQSRAAQSVIFTAIFQFHFNKVFRKISKDRRVRSEQFIGKLCQFFCDSWEGENSSFWFLSIVPLVEQWQMYAVCKYRGLTDIWHQWSIKESSSWISAMLFRCGLQRLCTWMVFSRAYQSTCHVRGCHGFQPQKPSSCVSNSYFSLTLVNWIAIWVCVPSATALDPRHDLYCSLVRLGSHFLSWKWWKRSLSGARMILE